MTSLSYDHSPSELRLLGDTIGAHLRRVAEEQPHREALVSRHENLRLTYADLLDLVEKAAKGLLAAGVEKGDRVAVWSTNNHRWVVTQYATALIGAVLVNINPAFRAHELSYVLEASRCRVLLLGKGFKDVEYLDLLAEICPDVLDCPPHGLRSPVLPHLRSVVSTDDAESSAIVSFTQLCAEGETVDDDLLQAREADLDCDDDINIQYTSGTTGMPKGVVLTHHNILNNAHMASRVMGMGPEDRLCVCVPFYHCFGMVLATLATMTAGGCLVLPSDWFDAAATLATVEAERCTVLHGVPTMFIAELNHPDFATYDLSSLRTGIIAGAPCPIELVKAVRERMHMPDFLIGYGQTEASPLITLTRPDDPEDKLVGSVGRVTPHEELKVVDTATGRTLPRGQPGEICCRGYNVMSRYDGDPQATEETVDEQGWLHTGDLGTMDEEGFISIVGRLKEMVIRGGENVYPREIEEFLHTLDIILDAYVVGVPDLKYGEELLAAVKLQDGVDPPDEETFRNMCRGRIASYKIPRYWMVVDEFPTTVTGKVQKTRLREMAIRRFGLEEAAAVRTA